MTESTQYMFDVFTVNRFAFHLSNHDKILVRYVTKIVKYMLTSHDVPYQTSLEGRYGKNQDGALHEKKIWICHLLSTHQ